jgi:hypothetical protein
MQPPVLVISALGVSRSKLLVTALSGDIGVGLWDVQSFAFHNKQPNL